MSAEAGGWCDHHPMHVWSTCPNDPTAGCEHPEPIEVTTVGDQRRTLLCTRCGTRLDGGPR